MHIGEKIDTLCRTKSIKQLTLANELKISPQAFSTRNLKLVEMSCKNLVLILLLSSCKTMYGLHDVHPYKASTNDLPASLQQGIFKSIDTQLSVHLNEAFPIGDSAIKKDLHQPLQFWIFRDKHLIANSVNCYTGGFPNLKWTIDQDYSNGVKHGPAKKKEPDVMAFEKSFGIALPKSGTVMLLMYAHFMGRQDKRFLITASRFLKAHPEIKVVAFNMDNTF